MSSGTSVKLLIRTAPCTPCGPVTMPTQTLCVASVTVFAAKRPDRSAAAGGSARRLFGGLQPFLSPRLWPRLDRGLAECWLFYQPGIAEKARDPIGGQRTYPEPVLNALSFEGHPIGMRAIEHRVVGPEPFDKAAIAGTARIRDDDAVIRALLRPSPREADLQRHSVTFF